MQSRFSERAKNIIETAIRSAGEMGHIYVGTEHLLLALVLSGETSVYMPGATELTEEAIRDKISMLSEQGDSTCLTPEDMTPALRRVLLRAADAAPSGSLADEKHLLYALLSSDCVATGLLEDMDTDTDNFRKALEKQMNKKSSYKKDTRLSTPTLDRYAVSLTDKALRGEIDPVVGREAEEERIIRILLRRRKNNPLLIGEAGVGKTAVAESIALRIAKGNVPDEMRTRRILSLDMSCLVAGTKYRGEFEEKLRSVIREATDDKDVILFIDEIHTLVGAGAAEGAVDASNILKPALARGEIQLIGATTPKEFKKSIEKDGALERRFQQVYINEPSVEECKRVLMALKGRYESHHGVRITHDALAAAAEYSHRYISGRRLPDKAIDLIDEAASAKRLSGGKTVTEEDIAYLTGEVSGVPYEFISGEESTEETERYLADRVVGQEKAVKAVAHSVGRRHTRISEPDRPLGSMLFYGPHGVGKTECAKALAYSLCGTENSFVLIDMSEYTEPHSVSRLIGAPPGYSGYGEGGVLTEAVRKTPFCVVLFDSAEKAHPDVLALASQILDRGVLTDSDGLAVSFSHATVIFTASSESCSTIGFSEKNEKNGAEKILPAEIIDRIEDIVRFEPLDKAALRRIASGKVRKLAALSGGENEVLLSDEDILRAVDSCGGSARALCRAVTRMARDAVWEKQYKKSREYQKST